MAREPRGQSTPLSVVTMGAAAVAVVCCAGLPLLSAALGGLTLGAAVSGGAAVVVLGGSLVAVIGLRVRRRRGREREPQR